MRYFHQKPYDQYNYYITPEKATALTNKIADLAMYVDPEEWLELPDFINVVREVKLEKETMDQYRSLEDAYILKLDEGAITAANAGVLTMKLRQFTGGAVYSSEGVWEDLHSAKLDILDDLIEEMAGEPLMVAYQFDHERERLLKRYPKALCLKGGMSKTAVTTIIDQWNSGECPLLLVQPASAALGLNLQFGGAAICWFTFTYNLEEYIQLNKRLHRQGQTKTVRCYLLSVEKTIDTYITKVLTKKDAVQEDLFKALKFEV
jgi:SNF2 family DNA or RNA helicase